MYWTYRPNSCTHAGVPPPAKVGGWAGVKWRKSKNFIINYYYFCLAIVRSSDGTPPCMCMNLTRKPFHVLDLGIMHRLHEFMQSKAVQLPGPLYLA